MCSLLVVLKQRNDDVDIDNNHVNIRDVFYSIASDAFFRYLSPLKPLLTPSHFPKFKMS